MKRAMVGSWIRPTSWRNMAQGRSEPRHLAVLGQGKTGQVGAGQTAEMKMASHGRASLARGVLSVGVLRMRVMCSGGGGVL